MALFLVQLSFDTADPAPRMAVRPAHRQYLDSLRETGKLVTAGPFEDQSGAVLVYDVADEAELREILAADPYTPAGVYELVTLKQWQLLYPLGG